MIFAPWIQSLSAYSLFWTIFNSHTPSIAYGFFYSGKVDWFDSGGIGGARNGSGDSNCNNIVSVVAAVAHIYTMCFTTKHAKIQASHISLIHGWEDDLIPSLAKKFRSYSNF